MFTEGGFSGHDGSSENSKSDQIPWPGTFPWNWRMAGNRVVTGFLPRTDGIQDNKKIEQAEERACRIRSKYVGSKI